MNPTLLEILVCPNCPSLAKFQSAEDSLRCQDCKRVYRLVQDKPVFIPISNDEVFSERPKSPALGSFWRRRTWEFVESFANKLCDGQVMLEVGAGRGYYKPLFPGSYIGTDIHLTTNVDFASNLVHQRIIRPGSVDLILLSNLLEHVFEFQELLHNAVLGLKPNGLLIVAVPFYGGIHYVPHDYFRYTHFTLVKFAEQFNLQMVQLEAVYQPFTVLTRAISNLERSIMPRRGFRNFIGKQIVRLMIRAVVDKILPRLITEVQPYGAESISDLSDNSLEKVFPYPLGYQAAYRKQV